MENSEIRSVLDSAYHKAGEITKSVLTLARVLSVKPKDLAEAIADGNSNAKYNAEFTAELIKQVTAKALADAKKAE